MIITTDIDIRKTIHMYYEHVHIEICETWIMMVKV